MIDFDTQKVFGTHFQPVFCKCFYYVSKILYHEKINLNGTINFEHVHTLKKHELWSYIFYLHYYNHTRIQLFKNMERHSIPDARRFFNVVMNTLEIPTNAQENPRVTVENLILFINMIMKSYDNLYNPLLMYLNKIIEKNKMLMLQGITIKTNSDKINVSRQIKV
jgi:hypothetical protein